MQIHRNPTHEHLDDSEHDKGFTLIEILIAIVLVGILSAVAVVGISNLVSKGSNSACTASGDAAKAASAVFFASNNKYPVDFKDLTTGANAPMALPAGTSPNPAILGTVAVTNGTWTLTMTPAAAGTGAAPTFGCTNT